MSDLEQKIREAAEKCRGRKWLPEGVDGLSTENGEPVVFDGDYDTSGFCQDEQREFCIAASPANILALLAEKDAEIERWKAAASEYQDGMYETATRAESAERERDEWKQIAGSYRNACRNNRSQLRLCNCNYCRTYGVLAFCGIRREGIVPADGSATHEA